MEDSRVANKQSRAANWECRKHFVMKLTYYDVLYKVLEFEDIFETV
jgi:hypothetical protein